MKNKRAPFILACFLLLAFMSLAALSVRPILVRTHSQVEQYRALLLEKLKNETDIRVTYRSLSPSLLSHFRVKKIALYDAGGETDGNSWSTETPFLEIDSALLVFDLGKVLRGDLALSRVRVSGVRLDGQKGQELLNRRAKQTGAPITGKENADAVISLLQEVFGEIAIQARNVQVSYGGDWGEAQAEMKSLTYTTNRNYFAQAKARGTVRVSLLRNNERVPVQAELSLNASVAPGLYGTTASLNIGAVQSGDVTLRRVTMLAEIQKQYVRVSTLKSSAPISALFEAQVPLGNYRAIVQASNLSLFSRAEVRNVSPKLRDMTIDGTYTLRGSFSVPSALIGEYSASGSVNIPNLIAGGMRADYDVRGTPSLLAARTLHIKSGKTGAPLSLDAAFLGQVNLRTLQPRGILRVNSFVLPNHRVFSDDMELLPENQGTRLVIPAQTFGASSLAPISAFMQLNRDRNALSFDVETSDLSHPEYGVPGLFNSTGTLRFTRGPSLNARISAENFAIETISDALGFFSSGTAPALPRYLVNARGGVSTDFSSLRYEVSEASVTEVPLPGSAEGEPVATLALSGTERHIALSRLDIARTDLAVHAAAEAYFSRGSKDIDFNSAITANGQDYTVSGIFNPGVSVTFQGSHGLRGDIFFPTDTASYSGDVTLTNFPLAYKTWIFDLSANANLSPGEDGSLTISVPHAEVRELSDRLPSDPTLVISGHTSGRSLLLDTILLADSVSEVWGSGALEWEVRDKTLQGILARITLEGGASEKYTLVLDAAKESDDVLLSGAAHLAGFPLQRVMQGQGAQNTVTGTAIFQGSLKNLLVSAQVQDISVILGKTLLTGRGDLGFWERTLHFSNINLDSPYLAINDLGGNFSLDYRAGFAQGDMEAHLGDEPFMGPLSLRFALPGGIQNWRQNCNIGVESTGLSGPFFDTPQAFAFTINKGREGWGIATERGSLSLEGAFSNDGDLSLVLGGNPALRFQARGTIKDEKIDVNISDVFMDASRFSSLLASPNVSIFSALVTGDLRLGGTLSQPNFDGGLMAHNLELNSPNYIPEHLTSEEVQFQAEQNRFSSGTMYLTTSTGSLLLAELEIIIARWALEELTLSLKTAPGVFVPLQMQLNRIGVASDVRADIQIQVTPGTVTVTGTGTAQDGAIQIDTELSENLDKYNPIARFTDLFTGKTRAALEKAAKEKSPRTGTKTRSPLTVVTDLKIKAGNRFQVLINPVLRGLITPGTDVGLRINTLQDEYEITGDIVLRGGEVIWLNRNFYLREGRVLFSEVDGLDPRVTLRAEVRERDAQGDPVRITLAAENQRLSELALALTGEENNSTGITYSASPAKSETEIMALLGRSVMADLDSANDSTTNALSVVGAVSDITVQLTLMRRIENALRKLLNVDIISLRATWLQNIIADSAAENDTGPGMTFGSVFNNSTFYVGKYFAKDLYFDAMLHFLYDESLVVANPGVSGLIFQPEIGLEIDMPFDLSLRWSFAPELRSWQQATSPAAWVPSAAITLTWRKDLEKVFAWFKKKQ